MSRLSGRPPPAPASTVSQGRCRPPSSIFEYTQSIVSTRLYRSITGSRTTGDSSGGEVQTLSYTNSTSANNNMEHICSTIADTKQYKLHPLNHNHLTPPPTLAYATGLVRSFGSLVRIQNISLWRNTFLCGTECAVL